MFICKLYYLIWLGPCVRSFSFYAENKVTDVTICDHILLQSYFKGFKTFNNFCFKHWLGVESLFICRCYISHDGIITSVHLTLCPSLWAIFVGARHDIFWQQLADLNYVTVWRDESFLGTEIKQMLTNFKKTEMRRNNKSKILIAKRCHPTTCIEYIKRRDNSDDINKLWFVSLTATPS